jgi:hypothetical protein
MWYLKSNTIIGLFRFHTSVAMDSPSPVNLEDDVVQFVYYTMESPLVSVVCE